MSADPTISARRVMVSGVGLHGALGDAGATFQSLRDGRSAVRSFRLPEPAGLPAVAAAPVPPWSLAPYLADRKLAKYMSPAAELAVLAAGRALEDAGLLDATAARASAGLFVATDMIAFDFGQIATVLARVAGEKAADMSFVEIGQEGLRLCHPLMPFKMLLNMPLGLVSIAYGLRGPSFITYPGADQGAFCLEAAARAIRAGRLERALVGACVQRLSLAPLLSEHRLGRVALSPEAARPYHAGHAGTAPTDMGVFLVLESEAALAARGRRARAVVGDVLLRRQPRSDLWRTLAGASRVDAVLTTGNGDDGDDACDRATARELWPDETPPLASFDGGLGFSGAAAFLGTAAVACQAFAAGALPESCLDPIDRDIRQGSRGLDRLLVSYRGFDHAPAAARLDSVAVEVAA